MRKYIIKRLLLSLVILFFVAFIIYALMRSLPTSYLETIARQKSMQPGSKTFEEWMEQLSATYGMDKGIIGGFFEWLGKFMTGKTIAPNAKSYDLRNVDTLIKFGTLRPGTYTYRVTAVNSAGTATLVNKQFKVY